MARQLISLAAAAVLAAGLAACSQSNPGTAGPTPSPPATRSAAAPADGAGAGVFMAAVCSPTASHVSDL
jgi:predicted small lipoprotein YifL